MRLVTGVLMVGLFFGCCLLPGCQTSSAAKKEASERLIYESFFKDQSRIRWVKVEAAVKNRDLASATLQASQLLVDYPDDSLGYLVRGRAYCLQQDYGLALADFDTAVRLAPENAEGYARRAILYTRKIYNRQKEQNDRALADLNQALGLGLEILNWDFEAAKGIMPINLYHERALVYQRLGNPEAALKNMNRAIALSKQQPNKGGLGIDYMRRSEIYYSLGRLDEAATDARRALGLFQGLSSAYKILGLVALNQEDLSQAVTYFDKALESLGEQKGWPYSEAQFGKAAVFWIQGQRSRAWDTLKTALQQTQGDAHVYFFLGFMAHSNSDTAQARAYFARAQELIPDVYQVRSEILASEKSDRWTQLRQEMVRVAGSYYGAGAEPIPQQRPVARLEIQQVRVVPNPVPAGAPFDIETTYRVSDSASREATLALLYRCEIYQGQQRLFGSKELSIQGQNGAEKTWVQHMNPVTLQGAFRVKTYLRYQGEEAVAAGDFRIQ